MSVPAVGLAVLAALAEHPVVPVDLAVPEVHLVVPVDPVVPEDLADPVEHPAVLVGLADPAVPVDPVLPAAARAERSAILGMTVATPTVPIPVLCTRPSTPKPASPSASRTAFCGPSPTAHWMMRTPTLPVTTILTNL